MTATPESHAIVMAFIVGLPLRPDAERVRAILAAAFVDHAGELWPPGDAAASPEWIRENIDSILASLEQLYAAVAADEHPGADAFLDRMQWLPPFLVNLAQPRLNQHSAYHGHD
jgi:hypothetical protein